MPSAFEHGPSLTVPASPAANSVAAWSATNNLSATIAMNSANLSGAIADDDIVLIYDTSTTSLKTVAKSVFVAGIGGTTVNGTADNAILTYINSSGEFTAETNLTWSGTMLQQGPAGSMPLLSGTWASNYSGFMCNAYYAGGWKYSGNNPAMGIRFHAAGSYANSMLFNVAPVNSSGAAATISNWDGADIKMIINSDGQVTKPRQSCGLVRVTSDINNLTGDGNLAQITFGTVVEDQNADWSTSNYNTFYAPVTGNYFFHVVLSLHTNLSTASTEIFVQFATDYNSRTYTVFNQGGLPDGLAAQQYTVGGSAIVKLEEGDYLNVKLRISGDGSNNVTVEGGGAHQSALSWCLLA